MKPSKMSLLITNSNETNKKNSKMFFLNHTIKINDFNEVCLLNSITYFFIRFSIDSLIKDKKKTFQYELTFLKNNELFVPETIIHVSPEICPLCETNNNLCSVFNSINEEYKDLNIITKHVLKLIKDNPTQRLRFLKYETKIYLK